MRIGFVCCIFASISLSLGLEESIAIVSAKLVLEIVRADE